MRVSAWEQERRDGVLRLSARVTWEDRDRADDVLWFEWPESLASSVSASACGAPWRSLPSSRRRSVPCRWSCRSGVARSYPTSVERVAAVCADPSTRFARSG